MDKDYLRHRHAFIVSFKYKKFFSFFLFFSDCCSRRMVILIIILLITLCHILETNKGTWYYLLHLEGILLCENYGNPTQDWTYTAVTILQSHRRLVNIMCMSHDNFLSIKYDDHNNKEIFSQINDFRNRILFHLKVIQRRSCFINKVQSPKNCKKRAWHELQ